MFRVFDYHSSWVAQRFRFVIAPERVLNFDGVDELSECFYGVHLTTGVHHWMPSWAT